MRRARFVLAIASALALAAGARASAMSSQSLLRVTFRNDTGVALVHLFASAGDTRLWGPDLLVSRPLPPGGIATYFAHFPERSAVFDFQGIDSRGDQWLIQSFRLDEGGDAIVRIGREHHAGAHAGGDYARVVVTNASNRVFSYLFIAPEESQAWGFDILDDATALEPGDSIGFVVPVGPKPRRYEILALSRDQAVLQRQVVLSRETTDLFIDFKVGDLH